MQLKLPQAFVDRMKSLLQDEYDSFIASYGHNRNFGLRVNTLKISVADFKRISPFTLDPVPWSGEGFYYEQEERPGKHPYYYAGLYYIQEPSAMSAVELLDIRPGERVLDLCAAPGGKSTQIAAKLQGQGLLVCNDTSAERIKALVKNIERSGIRNAVVTNESPESLSRAFAGYFDKILIDAPCSGEGMFRKDEDMVKVWSPDSIRTCAIMQKDILDWAAKMLVTGGTIVYSTCTFAPEENESQIAAFLDRHQAFSVAQVPESFGFSPGRADWVDKWSGDRQASESSRQAAAATARLWPHCIEGEGHFAAVLAKHSDEHDAAETEAIRHQSIMKQRAGKNETAICEDFLEQIGFKKPDAAIVSFGEFLYAADPGLPDLSGLKVARPGWFIGLVKKNRFVPSHALAMAISREEVARSVSFPADSQEIVRYLKGETLEIEESRLDKAPGVSSKGHCLVCVDGYSVGWAKWIDGLLKNEYPPGWRWTW